MCLRTQAWGFHAAVLPRKQGHKRYCTWAQAGTATLRLPLARAQGAARVGVTLEVDAARYSPPRVGLSADLSP